MNPYLQLNLTPEASDADIRAKYLELAKQYTPAHAPTEFARIAKAYALINSPEKRLQLETLGLPAEENTESLTRQNLALLRMHRSRPTWQSLRQQFGQAPAKA